MSPRKSATTIKIKRKKKGSHSKSKKSVPTIERRKHPRLKMELPLDYSRVDDKENLGGIVANASEGGMHVHIPRRLNIKDILKIEIFFARKLELNAIKAFAKIVWAYWARKGARKGHRYGLQFQSIDEGDLHKLKILLKDLKKTPRSKGVK